MPMPPQLVGSRKGRKVVKVNAMSYAKLLRLLWDGGYTMQELANETGLHVMTVSDYTKAMHKEGVLHIAGYAPDSRGRVTCRVYKLGPGKDAKRTTPTKAERMAKYRERQHQAKISATLAGQGSFLARKNGRIAFVEDVANEADHAQAA